MSADSQIQSSLPRIVVWLVHVHVLMAVAIEECYIAPVRDDIDHAVPLSAPSDVVYYVCKKCYRSLNSYKKAKVALMEGVRVGE